MRNYLASIVSVLFTFVKFSFMKLFHGASFQFSPAERFSPNVVVKVGRNSKLKLGNRCSAHSGARVCAVAGGSLRIGDRCSLNNNCMIVCRHKIDIGAGVEFGPGVLIYDHDHDVRVDGGLKVGKYKCTPVYIGENCWIGANTVILRGASIGNNCVIGAGSVVKGYVPDNTMLVQKRECEMIPLT